jgi:hypothetical protein
MRERRSGSPRHDRHGNDLNLVAGETLVRAQVGSAQPWMWFDTGTSGPAGASLAERDVDLFGAGPVE